MLLVIKKKQVKKKKKGSFSLKAFLGGFFIFLIVFGVIVFSRLNLNFITSQKTVLADQVVAITPTPVTPYSLSGKVYYDINNNGKFDFGEKVFSGGVVTIGNAKITRYLKTGSQGNYILNANPSGVYALKVFAPVGYQANFGNSVKISLNKNTVYNIGLQKMLIK